MRAETLDRAPGRHTKPLVIRGGLARTFGSLVGFLALLFLICGLYLLNDDFEHPLKAEPTSVVTAALSIALATILFYYLFKPHYRKRMRTTWFRGVG